MPRLLVKKVSGLLIDGLEIVHFAPDPGKFLSYPRQSMFTGMAAYVAAIGQGSA
jgi:hypothetical protein